MLSFKASTSVHTIHVLNFKYLYTFTLFFVTAIKTISSTLKVPGRFIFSLLKKYLRVNSITSSSPASEVSSAVARSNSEPSEFEKFYALDQLISELFTFFGWYEGSTESERGLETGKVMKGVSIFAGTLPTEQKVNCVCTRSCVVVEIVCETETSVAIYSRDKVYCLEIECAN